MKITILNKDGELHFLFEHNGMQRMICSDVIPMDDPVQKEAVVRNILSFIFGAIEAAIIPEVLEKRLEFLEKANSSKESIDNSIGFQMGFKDIRLLEKKVA